MQGLHKKTIQSDYKTDIDINGYQGTFSECSGKVMTKRSSRMFVVDIKCSQDVKSKNLCKLLKWNIRTNVLRNCNVQRPFRNNVFLTLVKRSCNYMLLYWVYVNSWLCFFTQDCCVASALECFRSQVLDLSVTDAKLKRSQKIVFNELRKSLIVSVCLLCLWAE